MHKILIDRFCEFQKSIQTKNFLTFLAIPTDFKALNEFIFVFSDIQSTLGDTMVHFLKKSALKNFSPKALNLPYYSLLPLAGRKKDAMTQGKSLKV